MSLGVTSNEDLANAKKVKLTAFKNSVEGRRLVAWVRSRYDSDRSARSQIQRQWYINLAMYGGNAYMELMGVGGASVLAVPPAPSHRVRARINRLRPIIRTEISRMTSQKPTAYIVPASSSDDDLFAAQAGEQVWESIYSRKQFNRYMVRNAFWTCMTGNGFIKTWWDQNAVDKYSRTPATELAPSTTPQGDICFGVVTPFNLFVPDLLEQEIEDQPYILHVYTRPVEWVKRFFKDNLQGNVTADLVSASELFESRYFEPAAIQTRPDAVLIIEAYLKPGAYPDYPDGAMVTLVGSEIVQLVETLPYSHGEYPFAKFDHVPTGKFYADSVLVDLNSLQKEYNRLRSQITEARNKTAKPQMSYVKGSLDPNRWTDEAGLLVPYMPGFAPPTPIPLQPLPNYVLEEQDRIISDMEDISGQHQVSRGMAPGSGVVAATAIAFLQEKDDSLMATTYGSIEMGIEKIAKQTLALVVDYWDMPRTIRTVGLDSSFDALELKGIDIKNGQDIRIESGSALPLSKPARQAFLMDLFQNGAITAEQMLDMLDIGGVNKLVERIRVDMRQAQRENLKMKRLTDQDLQAYAQQKQMEWESRAPGTTDPATGLPLFTMDPMTWPPVVPVNNWDNHPVHIATHNNYRKGQEYELLPDTVKEEFERHVRQHEQASAMQQQATMQDGMVPPGTEASAAGTDPSMAGQNETGGDAGAMLPPQGGQPQMQG